MSYIPCRYGARAPTRPSRFAQEGGLDLEACDAIERDAEHPIHTLRAAFGYLNILARTRNDEQARILATRCVEVIDRLLPRTHHNSENTQDARI